MENLVIRITGKNEQGMEKIENTKNMNYNIIVDFLKDEDIEIDTITEEEAYTDAFIFLFDMINLIDPDCDTEDGEQLATCCLKMGIEVNEDGIINNKSLLEFSEEHARIKYIF